MKREGGSQWNVVYFRIHYARNLNCIKIKQTFFIACFAVSFRKRNRKRESEKNGIFPSSSSSSLQLFCNVVQDVVTYYLMLHCIRTPANNEMHYFTLSGDWDYIIQLLLSWNQTTWCCAMILSLHFTHCVWLGVCGGLGVCGCGCVCSAY